MIAAEGKCSLLDIGAGTGDDAQFFMNEGFDVTAIDLSDAMVKICNERGIRASVYDLYELSQFGETFDAMWAMKSLIHVEKCNLPQVLQEIQQALNPSGLFFMGVYGGDEWEGILEGDLFSPPRYLSFYSEERMKEIVSQYFELVRYEKVEFERKYYFQALTLRKR
jgi:SAM-dependent methyltransferase